MTDGGPRRVRVTADPRRLPASRSQPVRSVAAGTSADAADDADAVYSRALRRTQLRLALGTVAGFVVVAVALTIVIAGIPELDRHDLGGVPLSWLLHAFAFYPVIFLFAVLYARGAARNEQRYRMLRDRG